MENPSRSKNTNALAGNVKPISGERRTKEVRPEELREALLNRRHSILKWMDDDIDQEKTNDGGIVGDVVDAAQGSNENEMAFQLAEVESRELGQINIALGKIGDGSYGICEDCNGKISPARLKALPFATKCIKCQEAYDETQSGSGSQDSWGSAFRGSSSGDDHSAQEMD
ncbi:MAG: TraR/DksA family transcriptional regulator [Planctomycetaceae bacterium]|nr:TraR/DksA family transcriptional regulator [Planctomycetaceae bacterium]